MSSIKDFFITSNYINNVSDEEYKMTGCIINSFKSISRVTYQSLYIIDYYKKNFLYVSSNSLFLCGYSESEVKELGYLFYLTQVPDDEHKMLMEINKSGFDFFQKTPEDERHLYTISYDFHLKNGRNKILINHKLTPLALTSSGKVWLATCIVSLSCRDSPGHVEIRKMGQSEYWEYSLESHKWTEGKGTPLSEREKNILLLSARGCTMNEIADRLCVAIDTVKFYKRRLFERLEVKNITEALSFATNYKLL